MPSGMVYAWLLGLAGVAAVIPLVICLFFHRARRVASWLLLCDVVGLATIHFLTPKKTMHISPCAAHLRQLYFSCAMYQVDHTNSWPTTWADIIPYVDTPALFECPPAQSHALLSDVDQWTPYILRPNDTNENTIIFYCSRTNHEGASRSYVVLAGGHVRSMDLSELTQQIMNNRNSE
jgi:hypothetical protein